MSKASKAIIIFSGGIDSTVLIALALHAQKECIALSFNYGQRHIRELKSATAIANLYQIQHIIINIDPATFRGPQYQCALTSNTPAAQNRSAQEIAQQGIPNTYVPARNTLFLSYALAQAELWGAQEIHFGSNALDFHPYPDCRPAYFQAFQTMAQYATKQATTQQPPLILTPLINLDKKQIIATGLSLNAPLHLTFSCYTPTTAEAACDCCDACMLRNAAMAGGAIGGALRSPEPPEAGNAFPAPAISALRSKVCLEASV